MGLGDFVKNNEFIKSQFIDVIEHVDDSNKLLVYKWERYGDEIKQGSNLIVREGQAAVFIYKGQLADIMLPGSYILNTRNLPVLSSLAAVPKLFNSPIKSDLYFINTTMFIGNKWGTKNPIVMRDSDFGVIRITSFGSYSFRVSSPEKFIKDVFGARKLNMTFEILSFLNSFVGESIAEVIASSETSVLDLAVNYRKMSELLKTKVNEKAGTLGLEITEAVIENVGLPKEVEAVVDEQSGIGLASKNMGAFMQYQTARAMRDASKQEGGLAGLGAGVAFGKVVADAVNNNADLFGNQSNTQQTNIEKLREYKSLLDDGIISQEEFDSIKKQLLNI